MTSSGLTAFNPSIADSVIEAFERIGIRSAEITPEHMYSARMSANLVLADWSNRGVNLFKVDLQNIPLVQGVTTYSIPASTIMILDVYLRQYTMGSPQDISGAFATTLNSSTVTATIANNGVSVGQYINVIIPSSVGGLLLYGFYLVTSVTSPNTFTFDTGSNATSSVSAGGTVPTFTTTANSTSISVNLPNNGYVAGGTFVVQISTSVGGTTLFGTYTIDTITDADNFTFTNNYAAGFNDSQSENAGEGQVATQQTSGTYPGYVDRVLSPLSRTDYSSLPNKYQQGFPSVYWFDRLINPNVTIWQVPDGNGPYALYYYRVGQIQDANPQAGQTADLPYRFQDAWAASLAYHLARKWKPALESARKQDAIDAVSVAMAEDRERVMLNIFPETEDYFR